MTWEPPTPTTDPAKKVPRMFEPPPLPPTPPGPRRKPMTIGLKKAAGHWKAITLIGSILVAGGSGWSIVSRVASKDDIKAAVDERVKPLEEIPGIKREQAVHRDRLEQLGEHSQWQTDRLLDLSRERRFTGSRARPRPIPPPPAPIEPMPDAGAKL